VSNSEKKGQNMVEKDKLIKNNFYFQIFYHSPINSIPEIKTFFYLGANIYNHGKRKFKDEYYFQDAESYIKHGNILEKGDDPHAMVFFINENQLVMMFDINGLIIRLKELKEEIPKMKNFKGKTYYTPYSEIKKSIEGRKVRKS